MIGFEPAQVDLGARNAPSDAHGLVGVGEVGVDEGADRPVFLQNLVEEHFGRAHDAMADELAPDMAGVAHHHRCRLAVAEPLSRKVLDELLSFSVGDHAVDLRAQNGRVGELAGGCEAHQLAVRRRAPQEIGEAAGESEVVKITFAGLAVEKLRRKQDAADAVVQAESGRGRAVHVLQDGGDKIVSLLAGQRAAEGLWGKR